MSPSSVTFGSNVFKTLQWVSKVPVASFIRSPARTASVSVEWMHASGLRSTISSSPQHSTKHVEHLLKAVVFLDQLNNRPFKVKGVDVSVISSLITTADLSKTICQAIQISQATDILRNETLTPIQRYNLFQKEAKGFPELNFTQAQFEEREQQSGFLKSTFVPLKATSPRVYCEDTSQTRDLSIYDQPHLDSLRSSNWDKSEHIVQFKYTTDCSSNPVPTLLEEPKAECYPTDIDLAFQESSTNSLSAEWLSQALALSEYVLESHNRLRDEVIKFAYRLRRHYRRMCRYVKVIRQLAVLRWRSYPVFRYRYHYLNLIKTLKEEDDEYQNPSFFIRRLPISRFNLQSNVFLRSNYRCDREDPIRSDSALSYPCTSPGTRQSLGLSAQSECISSRCT